MNNTYTILIVWSHEDESYLARVPELPGCMADGSTREEALENINGVIEAWIHTAKELGRSIPQPLSAEYLE